MQKKFLEEDRRILAERGREIRNKITGLQRTMQQLKLYDNVEEGKHFSLGNGVEVKSVEELLRALEVIDEESFSHHMKSNRNDYSSWIEHVVGHNALAKKLHHAKSRQEMVAIIENELTGNVDNIDPNHYFILRDGKVLKSINDLVVALYDIDDETFEYHHVRGDFGRWIKEVFKNEVLANKVRECESRENLIEMLRR